MWSGIDSHFKSFAFRVSLISRVANPNRMSAFRVWWLQTRKISLLTGVTILSIKKKEEDMSQSNLCFRFLCLLVRGKNVFERFQSWEHCFLASPTYTMLRKKNYKPNSIQRLDQKLTQWKDAELQSRCPDWNMSRGYCSSSLEQLAHDWITSSLNANTTALLTQWEPASTLGCVCCCTSQFSLTGHRPLLQHRDLDRTSFFCFL